MVEFVSWIGVVVIALFAFVGFAGVVATTVLSAFRAVRQRELPSTPPTRRTTSPPPSGCPPTVTGLMPGDGAL